MIAQSIEARLIVQISKARDANQSTYKLKQQKGEYYSAK
jgi:hypothetical protein